MTDQPETVTIDPARASTALAPKRAEVPADIDPLEPARVCRSSAGDVSEMTIWRWRRAGLWPEPDVTINGRHYWRRSTVQRAVAALVARNAMVPK